MSTRQKEIIAAVIGIALIVGLGAYDTLIKPVVTTVAGMASPSQAPVTPIAPAIQSSKLNQPTVSLEATVAAQVQPIMVAAATNPNAQYTIYTNEGSFTVVGGDVGSKVDALTKTGVVINAVRLTP